jgi:hypothetical protein
MMETVHVVQAIGDLGNAVRAGLADEELSRLPPLSNKKKRRKLSAPGVGIVDSLNI